MNERSEQFCNFDLLVKMFNIEVSRSPCLHNNSVGR